MSWLVQSTNVIIFRYCVAWGFLDMNHSTTISEENIEKLSVDDCTFTENGGFEIVAREDFSDVTFLIEFHHPLLAKAAKPGQFVIVLPHQHSERIPLTIADFNHKKGTVTLVIQAVGKTTKEMQDSCQVGTMLFGVVGPMGVPSNVSDAKKVICVGGGLGVALT